ncbi:MAG: lytic transglycosylase domain-containing protein [Pseudolabrys sp.]|jgi:soluble lytic murein transglycosylase-like protein|nr:lytic transglycosylase domain-containing protein [Pseudolabrys sp.]
MRILTAIAFASCCALLAAPINAQPIDANGNKASLDALVAKHAAANGIPESLIRRVIHRESRGNPRVVSKGNYGLMQIKLATARGMGYRGNAAGLLDADTNMTYAVRYLANAYKVAGGNPDRAVALYAGGYYYAAKRKGVLDAVDPNRGIKNPQATQAFAMETQPAPSARPAKTTLVSDTSIQTATADEAMLSH